MPNKVIETPYPLIDSDPHASRVIRYFRSSDYAVWAAATGAFPAALYAWRPYYLLATLVQALIVSQKWQIPSKSRSKQVSAWVVSSGFVAVSCSHINAQAVREINLFPS